MWRWAINSNLPTPLPEVQNSFGWRSNDLAHPRIRHQCADGCGSCRPGALTRRSLPHPLLVTPGCIGPDIKTLIQNRLGRNDIGQACTAAQCCAIHVYCCVAWRIHDGDLMPLVGYHYSGDEEVGDSSAGALRRLEPTVITGCLPNPMQVAKPRRWRLKRRLILSL